MQRLVSGVPQAEGPFTEGGVGTSDTKCTGLYPGCRRQRARSQKAVSALRIQGIGLNRGQAGVYGDSIAGFPAGEGVVGGER
jgi:hypothetical protein